MARIDFGDLAIMVNSFDGMSDVWDYFFEIFNRFWPNCKSRRYLINNSIDYQQDNLIVVKTGPDKNWFNMTAKGLSAIKEKYVFFLLEDDFMSKLVNEQDILDILNYMDENEVFFYRFTCPLNFPQDQGFLPVHGDIIYPISIQPAIWKKEVLFGYLKNLQENGCISPWDFERYFIKEYENYPKDAVIPGIRYDSRRLLGFKNGIIQGKWDPRIIKYYKNIGIEIDTSQRGIMPFKKVALDGIKQMKWIRKMSFEKQEKIKKVLKKTGIDFIT